ncbi:DNA gyrase inhibitor YacG [Gammaproteobacteria bacterium]|nr:DNA gyrase inhibitor YacG [Gammaproteobacteria bacterium]
MQSLKVKCPTCNAPVPWVAEEKYRPFCSSRCQRIDFGDWATESFTISDDIQANSDDEPSIY